MPESVDQYRNMVEEPWGRWGPMFYQMIWGQLELPAQAGLHLLDYGSGFGVSAAHYAENHRVTALEPSAEMRARRGPGPAYELIAGGAETLSLLPDGVFDAALCHNVLEYVSDQEAANIVGGLCRKLKPGGLLSVVKHNAAGKVMDSAVRGDLAKAAAFLGGQRTLTDATFGTQRTYEAEDLYRWAAPWGVMPAFDYGVRAFFGLGENAAKYDPAWFEAMLALERTAQSLEPYRSIAYNRHLILRREA
jgi:SAM-dependent methyltransferase